jgi:hypothetical protein
MDRLQSSIARLYVAFEAVPRPRHIDGCPCCIGEKNIDKLLESELADISPKDMSPYAASAFLTVGGVADYLYFLPRILDISATDEFWWPDPEVTARAISSSGIEQWSTKQLDALADYLESMIATAIERGEYHKIDGWMCAIARMGLSVHPYLAMIEAAPQAVLGYFDDNATCLPKGRLCNPFWDLPCEEHDVIVNWFHSQEVRQIVFDAYRFEY